MGCESCACMAACRLLTFKENYPHNINTDASNEEHQGTESQAERCLPSLLLRDAMGERCVSSAFLLFWPFTRLMTAFASAYSAIAAECGVK